MSGNCWSLTNLQDVGEALFLSKIGKLFEDKIRGSGKVKHENNRDSDPHSQYTDQIQATQGNPGGVRPFTALGLVHFYHSHVREVPFLSYTLSYLYPLRKLGFTLTLCSNNYLRHKKIL